MPSRKGIPNRKTNALAFMMSRRGLDLAEEASRLYEGSSDPEFKLKIISLLFPYVYPRATPEPEEKDVTPLDEMTVDEMKRLEASALKGLEELRAKIKQREQP